MAEIEAEISAEIEQWTSTRLVATKNRLVCGKLMARQILTRFDPGKKSAALRQKIGWCAAALRVEKLLYRCLFYGTPQGPFDKIFV